VKDPEFEVLLEAYILKDDATGRVFVDVLAAAARRGVVVRVLADAFGSSDTRLSSGSRWRKSTSRCIFTTRFSPTSGTSPTAITARSSSRTAASRSRAA